jgi:hypothetical protein
MEASLTTEWDPSAWAPGCKRIDLIHPPTVYSYFEGGHYSARLIRGNLLDDYLIRRLCEETGFSLAKPATTNSYTFIDDSSIIPLLCTIPWEELCSSCVRSILVSMLLFCFTLDVSVRQFMPLIN